MREILDERVSKIVKEIVEEARTYLEKTGDDKRYLHPREFLMIAKEAIKEGTNFMLNRAHCNGGYVHQLTYQNIVFITASDKRIKLDYEK